MERSLITSYWINIIIIVSLLLYYYIMKCQYYQLDLYNIMFCFLYFTKKIERKKDVKRNNEHIKKFRILI